MSRPVLIVDNYDSFTGLIAYYVQSLTGTPPLVYYNDAIDVPEMLSLGPSAIIVSPGPGSPTEVRDTGACPQLIEAALGRVPLLGVCLGHQLLCSVLGGRVAGLDQIRHGEVSQVEVDLTDPLYRGLSARRLDVMRYHSLAVLPETLPSVLKVSGVSVDGVIMSVSHRTVPAHGVQFHPESVATPDGWMMFANFLGEAGVHVRAQKELSI